jgi:hypothetical protein
MINIALITAIIMVFLIPIIDHYFTNKIGEPLCYLCIPCWIEFIKEKFEK